MKKHASNKPSCATRPNRKTYVRTYVHFSCSRNWSPATRQLGHSQLDNRSSEEERGDRRGSRAPTDATRPPVSSLIHPRDEKGGRYAVLHRISKRIPVTVATVIRSITRKKQSLSFLSPLPRRTEATTNLHVSFPRDSKRNIEIREWKKAATSMTRFSMIAFTQKGIHARGDR